MAPAGKSKKSADKIPAAKKSPAEKKAKPPSKKALAAAAPADPDVLNKIVTAIRAATGKAVTPNGVSRANISKYLKTELDFDDAELLKTTLKKGVENGTLEQSGQSFRVGDDPGAPPVPQDSVGIEDVKEGKSGPACENGDTVVMKYEGKLANGSVFDKSNSFEFTLGDGEVIEGWDEGIPGMKVGGVRKLVVPSKLGYGKEGSPPEIPPHADLYFTVTLKKIK